MEGGRKQSGSSLTTALFGAKDSPRTSTGSSSRISSIFETPPRVSGVESQRLLEAERKKNGSGSQAWIAKNGDSGQEQSQSREYYQEQRVQPCHYSSSIYYGGQDVYSQPKSGQNPGLTTFNKNKGEDDTGSASIGNWWEGSYNY